jgi:hypothetical protein
MNVPIQRDNGDVYVLIDNKLFMMTTTLSYDNISIIEVLASELDVWEESNFGCALRCTCETIVCGMEICDICQYEDQLNEQRRHEEYMINSHLSWEGEDPYGGEGDWQEEEDEWAEWNSITDDTVVKEDTSILDSDLRLLKKFREKFG